MSSLTELAHETYDHLFEIDPRVLMLDKVDDENVTCMLSKMQPRVMDPLTSELLEVFRVKDPLESIDYKKNQTTQVTSSSKRTSLFKAVNHTKTRTGAAVLFRSLVQPLSSLDLIHAKQESVREIERNSTLRKELADYVNSAAKNEEHTYSLFFKMSCGFHLDQYTFYKGTMGFFKGLVEGVKKLSSPESEYLKLLTDDIRAVDNTYTYELIKGPVYQTFHGLKPGKLVRFYTPRIKFTLRAAKPSLWIPFFTLYMGPVVYAGITKDMNVMDAALMITMFVAFPSMMWLPFGPINYDNKHFVKPLTKKYKEDGNIRKSVEALGKIDELLSFYEYSQAMGHEMVIPTVTESDSHYFTAKDVRNPTIAKGNPNYVPNDVSLNGQKLTVITGPNSGGKTTICKTIAQAQILGQIGCYVPAKEAEMSIADGIFYQAPMFNSLTDVEGRFGTELKRTKEIFLKTTPKSLVILDDSLAGATTHEENIKVSYDVLDGFYTIGNNSLLVTHNIELANMLQQEGRCQYLQVEFRNKKPTHRIIPGISKDSHAEDVAKKIGFSHRDIQKYLKSKGYLK